MKNLYLIPKRRRYADDEFGPVGAVKCTIGKLDACQKFRRCNTEIREQYRTGISLIDIIAFVHIHRFYRVLQNHSVAAFHIAAKQPA